MIHELKCEEKYFNPIIKGEKTFEVRYNDRRFCVGDILALNETKNGIYTRRSFLAYVDYILDDKDFCKDGFIILGIKPYKSHMDFMTKNINLP